MKKENREMVIEKINTFIGMAEEFKPDEGVLDEDGQQIYDEITNSENHPQAGPIELKEQLSGLTHFCGEWFPDGDAYDEEEIEDFNEEFAAVEGLLKDDSVWAN